jgi:hypothetical protein
VVEIAPAAHLDPQLRTRLTSDSVKLAKQVRAMLARTGGDRSLFLHAHFAPLSCGPHGLGTGATVTSRWGTRRPRVPGSGRAGGGDRSF